MKYELLIGRRYLRSSRGNRFVSFISVISMVGVAIGVAVLIVVLSVMNGFEQELRGRILSLTSHATISAFGAGSPDWQGTARKIGEHPEVVAAAPYIEDQALLIAGDKSSGALVTGVLPEDERKVAVDRGQNVRAVPSTSWSPASTASCSVRSWRKALGVALGDRVVIVTPLRTYHARRRHAAHRALQSRRHLLDAGMYEFDRNLAYVHLEDAARLYRMGDRGDGPAAEAGRHVHRAARRARPGGVAGRRLLRR